MILSLDLSTKSSGFAIFDGTDLVDYGCFTASSVDVIKRIQKMTKCIREEVLNNYDIETVIIEEVRPDTAGGQHTQKILLWLQASVAFMLHDNFPKVEIVYTYPSEWRKQCGIKQGRGVQRKPLKQADIDFVSTNYKIDVNDDIADAICIGHAYVNQLDDCAW